MKTLAGLISVLAVWLAGPSATRTPQMTGATGCDTNIVSSTVVATFCGHASGDSEVVDLFILWRGRPGWFQMAGGGSGSGGSNEFPVTGGRSKGRVSRSMRYGPVTITFEADFDAGTASVGDTTVDLKKVNTVLVDHVDRSDARAIVGSAWTEPRLPLLAGDMNLALAQRSRLLREYLQCHVPMPASTLTPLSRRPPIITVCEKLKSSQGK